MSGIVLKKKKQERKAGRRMVYLTAKRQNGEFIDLEDAEELEQQITDMATKQGLREVQIMMRGLAPDKWTTFKNFDEPVDYLHLQEYYNNLAKDPTQFTRYSKVQVVVSGF